MSEFKDKIFNKTISQVFHEQTKIARHGKKSDVVDWPKEWIEINHKGYPRFNKISLPKPIVKNSNSFFEILMSRCSRRGVGNNRITKQQLSDLLYFSGGIRSVSKNKETRPYASAGARYPLEIYPFILNGDELDMGLYHYHLKTHSLEYMWGGEKYVKAFLDCFDQPWIKQCAVIFIISAVFWRTKVKYGDRGYRYVLLDAGHLCQNLYLVCESLGLNCCEIGGFVDDKLNNFLDIGEIHEAAIVAMGVGITNKK